MLHLIRMRLKPIHQFATTKKTFCLFRIFTISTVFRSLATYVRVTSYSCTRHIAA